MRLQYASLEKGATVVLFGHTHKVFYDKHNGLNIMNPGSIGVPTWGKPASYGVLTIDGDEGIVDMNIIYIEKN